MHAIITAGGTPAPNEALYKLTHGLPKAMLPIGGQAMIQWVVNALSGSDEISDICVVGLPPFTEIISRHPLTILPEHGDMIENIRSGIDEIRRLDPSARKVLVISSDIPAVQPDMVDWVIKKVEERDADLYYNVISREVMERAFPGSKRTYTRLKDLEVCGGDLNAIDISFFAEDNPFFHRIIDFRKNPFKQAYLFGFDILLLLALNRLSLQEAETKISQRMQARGAVLMCPFAEIGMDVDKPHQFEMVQTFIQRQSSQ
jgi:GTP:adenosylcobinamide-phosphate guanylyltransferase